MKKLVAAAAFALLALTACGGEDTPADETTPADVLAEAKAQLDEAASWHLSLSTSSVPESGNGVLSADGVGTHAPAWEGEVKVLFSGLNATVPIVAVDGKVHAKLPLTPTWSEIDPAEYGAPNPAEFMDPDNGISAMLVALEDAQKGEQTRDGGQIVTTYTGTLPGARVASIIPSADEGATFETSVGINEDGQVTTVSVTGPFFSDGNDVTYDLRFSSYGEDVKISAP